MKVISKFTELKKLSCNKKIVETETKLNEARGFGDRKKIDILLLKYLKQLLVLASKTKGIEINKFLEDLYWSRYEYCINETDDNWEISMPVRCVFFEFQKNQPLEKMIKAVEAVERKVKKIA